MEARQTPENISFIELGFIVWHGVLHVTWSDKAGRGCCAWTVSGCARGCSGFAERQG